MLKKASKEQEADATVNMTGSGDVTMNVTGLNRQSLLNELENKIGEIDKIKEKEAAANAAAANAEDDQETGSDNQNFEPAEKGNFFPINFNLSKNDLT